MNPQDSLSTNNPRIGISSGRGGIPVTAGRLAADFHADELGRVRVHQVNAAPDTLAHMIFGRDAVEATCVHHQTPGAIGERLVASIVADDGAVEVVEDRERRVLGVIWHPKLGLDRTPTHQLVYDRLVQQARIGVPTGAAR